jgi:hypothetical protein
MKVARLISNLGCWRLIILTDKTVVECLHMQVLIAQFTDPEKLPDVFEN